MPSYTYLDVVCPTCGKKHRGRPCYRETEAYFSYGKQRHMIRECPKNKKFINKKPKKEKNENKWKPRVQGQVFAMTHRDAKAPSDVVTSIIQIHTLFSRALDPSSTYSFFSISFVGLLDMAFAIMDFDLIIATLMKDFVVTDRMLRDCLVMISYSETLVDLVLLHLQDFDVILEMDWLASYLWIVFGKGWRFTFLVSLSLVLRGSIWTNHCI